MKKLFFTLALICFVSASVQAQTTVTFNVNMKPLLADSIFVPNQDMLRISGNLYPLSPNNTVQLIDETPIDSIYTAKIRFSANSSNQVLEYNYQIVRPENNIESENNRRRLPLNSNSIELPPIYFNAFAW